MMNSKHSAWRPEVRVISPIVDEEKKRFLDLYTLAVRPRRQTTPRAFLVKVEDDVSLFVERWN